MSRLLRLVVTAVAVLSTDAVIPTAQSPARGVLVAFGIRAAGVHSEGGEGGGGSMSRNWAEDGGTGRIWVSTAGSCGLALSFERPAAAAAPAIVWSFDVRLISHTDDGAVIDLVSRREVNDPSLPLERITERHRQLGLSEGQPLVLEYTQLNPAATAQCDGYVIEAGMHFEDPPEVADARLAYDMWLIRTDEKGTQTTQRIESQAGQGKSAEFGFAPMWFDRDGSENPTGPVGIDVYGTIRGRLKPDGTVHLNVGAVRFVRDRMRSGWAEAGGKSTDIPLGETIEVQLPPVSGSLGPFGSLSPIFRGQRIAVRVTPRRVS